MCVRVRVRVRVRVCVSACIHTYINKHVQTQNDNTVLENLLNALVALVWNHPKNRMRMANRYYVYVYVYACVY